MLPLNAVCTPSGCRAVPRRRCAGALLLQIFEGTAPSGYIKVGDLITALTTYCSDKITEAQASELISQLEPDTNGLVNYVEYVSMMMSD